MNVRYDQDLDLAVLDFTSAIAVTLEDAIADGAITNVQIFFEKIIKFAKKNEAKDPAWGGSDSLGVNIVGSSLKQLLLSLLPSEIKKGGKKAFHFIVKDIARSDLGNA
ncbi:hypothetical protein [Solidesulfovibrio fructosivorans]|uniref:hypothetical protein n=1 Tax=Solidesulfovibrio fructosivorans TaxID=878 RepID=UPI0011802203|nr:hypothetical protein [Solidesulfovibrio fructosivorans]